MNRNISEQTLSLWAKTGDEQTWLSLHQHMIDSADVAGYLYDFWLPQSTQRFLGQELGLNGGEARSLITWLAGAHDIGKASIPFQFQIDQSPEHRGLADRVRAAGFPSNRFSELGLEVETLPHSVYSQVIQQWWLRQNYDWSPVSAAQLASVGGAHHGLPPTSPQLSSLRNNLLQTHAVPWQDSWQKLLGDIAAHTGAAEVLRDHPRLKTPVHTQMVLTGLVIMSDWIASNDELFPLVGPHNPRDVLAAGDRIENAMDQLRLPPSWRPTPCVTSLSEFYRQRFNWSDDFTPNELQLTAAAIAKSVTKPGLFIIEAPMGSGKTEAGLVLADIIATQLNVGGLIFATPTTATSDGLFGRTVTWAQNTQERQQLTSMFLAHSRNTLSDDFMNMRRGRSLPQQPELDSQRSQAVSHEWLYGRKKGILSDIVIGTVDQVLQMALQTKHVMLKHLSFAGKIVLIDEVHSYDAYMQTYLQRAVQWLASYGATVILLSATLPQSVREALSQAYQAGLGERPSVEVADGEPDLSYPLITQVDAAGVRKHVLTDDTARKEVRVREIDDSLETLVEKMTPVRENGGCVVVICNTVQRAQEVYEHIKPLFDQDISLLHARFTSIDRKEKEEQLLRFFGAGASRESGRPPRRVLVATQIVEQSLDLDFDMMITDFCPSDLLLQRAGRLHRHHRPDSDRPQWTREPVIYVRGLESAGSEADAPVFSKQYSEIYAEAILLSSYALLLPKLRSKEPLALPQEISSLVQHTYRMDPTIPATWVDRYQQSATYLAQKIKVKRSKANAFLLKDHRSEKTMLDVMPHREIEVKEHLAELKAAAQVRDIDPTLEVLLVQRNSNEGYRLLPGQSEVDAVYYAHQTPDDTSAKLIALNSVRLPFYFSLPRQFDQALEELEKRYFFDAWQQSLYLRGQLILPLDENLEAELAGRTLRYSQELGLQLLPQTNDLSQDAI